MHPCGYIPCTKNFSTANQRRNIKFQKSKFNTDESREKLLIRKFQQMLSGRNPYLFNVVVVNYHLCTLISKINMSKLERIK